MKNRPQSECIIAGKLLRRDGDEEDTARVVVKLRNLGAKDSNLLAHVGHTS